MTDEEKNLVEALREDAEWARSNEWEIPITLVDHLEEAAGLIEALATKVPRWINIKDHPPLLNQRVQYVPTGKERVSIGNYHGEGLRGGHYMLNGNRLETTWWWMPTPELPEEGAI